MNEQDHQEVLATFEELKVATINLRDDCRVLCHVIKRFGDLAERHGLDTPEVVQETNDRLLAFQGIFDDMVSMVEDKP